MQTMKPMESTSSAAALLGSVRSDCKARSSRANGKLGGRPSSGFLPDRVMARALRTWCQDHNLDYRRMLRLFRGVRGFGVSLGWSPDLALINIRKYGVDPLEIPDYAVRQILFGSLL